MPQISTYRVELEDGRIFNVEMDGAEPPTEEEVYAFLDQQEAPTADPALLARLQQDVQPMASHGAPSVMDQVRTAGVLGPGMMPPLGPVWRGAIAAAPKAWTMAKTVVGAAAPNIAQVAINATLPPWVAVPLSTAIGLRGMRRGAPPRTSASPASPTPVGASRTPAAAVRPRPAGPGRQLPAGPRIAQPAPDPSFVRGVPAQYATTERLALPAGRAVTPMPAAPDPSFVRGVPAEYGVRVAPSAAPTARPPVLARGLPTSQAQPVSRPRATRAPKPAAAPASTAAPAAPPLQPPGSPAAPGAPLSGPTSQSAPSPQTGAPAAPSSGPRPHPEGGVWSPQRIQNELGIQARRQQVTLSKAQADEAATLVSQGRTPADAVAQVATKANTPLLARPKLTAAETKVYARLIGQGKTDAEATQILEQQRLLVGQLGTPSSETVRQSVARRNNTGRWEPPKADEAARLEAARRKAREPK